MRVLVDTSAWVEFFNGRDSPEARALQALLSGHEDVVTCGVVVAEIFQGLREPRSRSQIETLMRKLPFLEAAGVDTYLHAATMYRELRARGITVRSTIDCLIVALAEEHRCALLARDRDIAAILDAGVARVKAW